MSNNLTVKTAYDDYMKYGSSSWAPRTKLYYEKNLHFFLEYLEKRYQRDCDDILIRNLPKDILKDYVIYLRSREKFMSHPLRSSMTVSGTLKSNTVNTYMRAVKAFTNWLYENNYVAYRYTEGLKLPKADNEQIVPLLAAEVRQLDAVFDLENLNDLRNLCIVHFMLDAGLRTSEVCKLRPADIIFSSNTIVINCSKGDRSRVVILAPPLRDYLKEYMERSKPAVYLFRSIQNNQPMQYSSVRSLFARLIRNTGIDRLHPHLLRHTFATSYMLGGGDLETLRILMGHSDYSVTRVYLHLASQYRILGAEIYRLDSSFFRRGYQYAKDSSVC